MIWVVRRRHIAVAIGCCVVLALIPVARTLTANRTAESAAVVNWGLSFLGEGRPPVGNASAETLKQYNAYYMGSGEKVLYLTFDAGFENGHTAAILDTLKKHGATAAFFLVGHYLETAPELVKRMVDEGHTVGNHTYHHPDMSAITDKAAFERELQAVETKFTEITGQTLPKYYRPPQGKYQESNLKAAQELGYTTVFWSLAYVDWLQDDQPDAQTAFQKLLPRTHDGAVVLLHSTSATNAAILDELLTRWEGMGYRFGSITELG